MKRRYTKPALESEEALEQTSLQCNVSYFPMEAICEWGENAWLGGECRYDVAKGGAFFVQGGCGQDINAEWDCLAVLS